jgi:hypothetical protein
MLYINYNKYWYYAGTKSRLTTSQVSSPMYNDKIESSNYTGEWKPGNKLSIHVGIIYSKIETVFIELFLVVF